MEPSIFDLSIFTAIDTWLALLTLAIMEIVLGIDNIVFLSILTDRLPEHEQQRGRTIGLGLALVSRIALLLAINWVMQLTTTLFTVLNEDFSGRDLILGAGGLFLIAKATHEIFEKMETIEDKKDVPKRGSASFAMVMAQIAALDIVFSFDSVVTAVGMAEHVLVMIIAMVVAVVVMMISAGAISRFINTHPSMVVLALAFLILIGVVLVAESLGHEISKGYIYFAMAFSFAVELVNMRLRKRAVVPASSQ